MKNEKSVGRPNKGGRQYNSVIAERLRNVVEGRSNKEVADDIGISRQAAGNVLTGANKPDIDTISKFAKNYNVSSDYLLGLSDVRSLDLNTRKVCEFTGLSQEAVEKLHSKIEKDSPVLSDEDKKCLCISDDYTKTNESLEIISNMICDKDFETVINRLVSYYKITSLLLHKVENVKSIEDVYDGYLRGLIIKTSLIESDISKYFGKYVNQFDHTNSSEYNVALSHIYNDIKSKKGIAEGADDYEIELAFKHLDGQLDENEYSLPSAKKTLDMLMLGDIRPEEID